MANSMKVRAKTDGEITTVKVLVSHPMETGTRKNSNTGELIPAHYIQEFKAQANGKTVFKGNVGAGISKNPYFAFKFKGASSGDTITLSWLDNKGASDSMEAKIK